MNEEVMRSRISAFLISGRYMGRSIILPDEQQKAIEDMASKLAGDSIEEKYPTVIERAY